METGTDITITTGRGYMPVYMARPTSPAPWPGVLVISDALGMTTDLRNQADWLASEGYLAAAPDLYYWGGRIRCLFTMMAEATKGSGPVFEDFDTVRTWLAARRDCTGSIGVVGFCMGGGFAVLLAGTGTYDAASVNYGSLPRDAAVALAASCPIVGSYGAQDLTLRKTPRRLEEILTGAGIANDVMVYPEAGHAFMNDHDPAEVPAWAIVAGRLSHSTYHEPSAADARRRIVDFFDTHLR